MVVNPIIVVEGCEGVGKTTLAQALSGRLGVPVIRPFRPPGVHHGTGSEHEQILIDLDIPYNTWIDDMYVADLLRTFRTGGVLDRSFPSALVHHSGPPKRQVEKAWNLWQLMLNQAGGALYVWIQGSYELARSRTIRAGTGGLYQERDDQFRSHYERWVGHKLQLSADDVGLDFQIELVLAGIGKTG